MNEIYTTNNKYFLNKSEITKSVISRERSYLNSVISFRQKIILM